MLASALAVLTAQTACLALLVGNREAQRTPFTARAPRHRRTEPSLLRARLALVSLTLALTVHHRLTIHIGGGR
jgi:hypothetical protein